MNKPVAPKVPVWVLRAMAKRLPAKDYTPLTVGYAR